MQHASHLENHVNFAPTPQIARTFGVQTLINITSRFAVRHSAALMFCHDEVLVVDA